MLVLRVLRSDQKNQLSVDEYDQGRRALFHEQLQLRAQPQKFHQSGIFV